MSKEHLFDKHLDNLRNVYQTEDDIFICPICFGPYTKSDIRNGKLTIGHIWPKYFREQSRGNSNNSTVLLCATCNSKAGSFGDAAMQCMEDYFSSQQIHQSYNKPQVIYIYAPHEPLSHPFIKIQALVRKDADSVALTPCRDKKGNPLFNGQDWIKAQKYLKDGGTMVIHPYGADWERGIEGITKTWKIAQVGLLTSAYLYAFYALGYGYILQQCLDPVRSYIRASFFHQVDDRLNRSSEKDMMVDIHHEFYAEPRIEYVSSHFEDIPSYLAVFIFRYAIRLPCSL